MGSIPILRLASRDIFDNTARQFTDRLLLKQSV